MAKEFIGNEPEGAAAPPSEINTDIDQGQVEPGNEVQPTPKEMFDDAVKQVNIEKGYVDKDKPPGDPSGGKPPEQSDTNVEPGGEAVIQDTDSGAGPKGKAVDKPDDVSLIVDGKTEEEIETQVAEVAKKLGYSKEQADLILQANFKKRWKDTRDHHSQQGQKLADLEKQLAEKPPAKPDKSDTPTEGAPDPSDILKGLSEDELEELEESPVAKKLLIESEKRRIDGEAKIRAERVAETEKAQAESDKQDALSQEQTKLQDWREGVEKLVPGGLDIYSDKSFEDWERNNASRLSEALSGYDKYDPVGTAELIRIYQKEKGLIEEANKKESDERKEVRKSTANQLKGGSTPQEDRRVKPKAEGREAMLAEALQTVYDEKQYGNKTSYTR